MNKTLLSLLISCLIPMMAQAQMLATPRVEAAEGQLWWENYDPDANLYVDGTGIAEHYDVAAFIPADVVGNGGLTICGMSIIPATDAASNVKVWVASQLPGSDGEDILEAVEVAKADLEKNKFNDVKFTQQHAVPAEGLYVGLSFDIPSFSDNFASAPMVYTNNDNNREKAFYYRTTSTRQWLTHKGNAAVKVLFSGNFAKNAASASNFATCTALKGGAASVPVNVRNQGVSDISNLTFTITTDGVTSDEITIAADIPANSKAVLVNVPFAADEQAKVYKKVLTITKVNGQPNEYQDNTASGELITVATKFTTVPLIETFMGTWSASSPRGIVNMENAAKKYSDKAVLLNVHCSNGTQDIDPMETPDYLDVANNITSVPMVVLNRKLQFLLYTDDDITPRIERDLERTAPASIECKAQWASDNDIFLKTTTTFGYDSDNANYGIAYVLVSDDLKGSGTEWMQANRYSGQSGQSSMQFWYDAQNPASGVTYDRVPVAAWSVFSGVENSVPKTVTAGGTTDHHYNANIAGNKIIQDKSKLTIVALLIDNSSLDVVNACQTTILPFDPQGIETVGTDANVTEMERYDAAGRRITSPQRGLNIIRMSDGTTVKRMK